MPIILGANSAATGAFTVDNSCCFNKADSPYLEKTQSAGNRKKWSFSVWFKIGQQDGVIHYLLGAFSDGSNYTNIEGGDGSNYIRYGNLVGGGYDSFKRSNQQIRDPSAWYHMLCVYDSANADSSLRQLLYLNGTQVTSFASDTTTTLNQDSAMNDSASSLMIGNLSGESSWFDGLMAEVVLLDGTAASPTDFGEFDEDSPTMWKPKDPSGLAFGTNGFYLDFKDSANLGNDANGGTDFTENGIIAADQCQDSPTNSFCTLNPLDNATSSAFTFANGNSQAFQAAAAWRATYGTMAPSSGKWYYECIGGNASGHLYPSIASPQYAAQLGVNMEMGTTITQPSYGLYGANGSIMYATTSAAGQNSAGYSGTFTESNYIGVYFDLDNNKVYWAIDGTIQNSGTGFGIQADFAYMPAASLYSNTAAGTGFNFGNGAFNGVAIGGTTYNDANGYGIFKYSPNDGGAASFDSSAKDFLAVCTKNLAEYG